MNTWTAARISFPDYKSFSSVELSMESALLEAAATFRRQFEKNLFSKVFKRINNLSGVYWLISYNKTSHYIYLTLDPLFYGAKIPLSCPKIIKFTLKYVEGFLEIQFFEKYISDDEALQIFLDIIIGCCKDIWEIKRNSRFFTVKFKNKRLWWYYIYIYKY